MKKTLLVLFSSSSLLFIECKKQENATILQKKDSANIIVDSAASKKIKQSTETSFGRKDATIYEYTYTAFDGSKAEVTFTNYPDKSYLLIKRNGFKIQLPQTEAWAKGAIYEKDGIKAESKGDKLTITQNGKTYELEKKK